MALAFGIDLAGAGSRGVKAASGLPSPIARHPMDDDPWWNIRVYLPKREVRKLFAVWLQLSTDKPPAAQLLTDKTTAEPAKGQT